MPSSPTACPQCALEFSGGEIFCAVDGARLVPVGSGHGHDSGSFGGLDPLINQTLAGRYRILRKIGEGGMGIVYEAIHVVIEKSVALKVLREDFSHREDVVERFRQEAKSASRIGHEHIIDISDFGVTPQGAHFFVMELLHGRDLAEELEQRGPLSAQRAVGIALQCAKALEAAHAKGIVHRDMKPENIFLMERDTGEDFVKIVDFGIAKMSDIETGRSLPGRKITKTGMIFGTPEYMSPEQASGKPLDHRVDIYGLGIILYELMSGRVPFMGDTFMGILTQHMFEQAVPLRIANPSYAGPPELEALITRMLAKDAADRPQSMSALAGELWQLQQGLPSSSSGSSRPRGSFGPPGTLTHMDQPVPRFAAPGFSSPPPRGFGTELDEGTLPRRRSSAPWIVLGAAAGLLVMGSLFALREQLAGTDSARAAASAHEPPPSPVVPVAPVAPAPAAPPVQPERAPAPREEAASTSEVSLQVTSEPGGASVSIDGVRACAETPCRVPGRRGSVVQVTVQKAGYRSARAELTLTRDLNQVELVLSRRREGARPGNRMEGDLMLPDAFGKR